MPISFTLDGTRTVYGRKERPRHIHVGKATVYLQRGEGPHHDPKPEELEAGSTVWVEEAVTLSSFHAVQITVSEKGEVAEPKKKGRKKK